MEHKYTNELIKESSPYLLQHAHNPVNWMPWNPKTLELAKTENKPLLISVGYSACHWCHVMEHESFEDSAVAKIMNDNFICIKIDREERPDIDQIYMSAVQKMTGRGGWPLNCFATPDGRPFYGGTYFPKEQWVNVLQQLSDLYKNDYQKVDEYANKLTEDIKNADLIIKQELSNDFTMESFEAGLKKWTTAFDEMWGGNNQAPKFPIPNNYEFLLRNYYHTKDANLKNHLLLSLKKMAYGGIYDQVGGGFARYSTDEQWKVPHFEKMLYDNAQLIGLYSKAYRLEKNPIYKKVVFETIEYLEDEMLDESGAFYSALDADSEGVEGKYYVWQKNDLKALLGNNFKLAADYYNINNFGYWEHDNYILIRKEDNEQLAKKHQLTIDEFETKIEHIRLLLKEERKKRIKPGLDDKSLTSWNALCISGLTDAYLTFGEEKHLELAINNANFILKHQLQGNGALWHSYKNGKSTINGYLEDYCFTIEAFTKLYTATLNESWLLKANKLMQFTIEKFYDSKSGMFYFTSTSDPELITKPFEVSDNVIPASNSVMAQNLFYLGKVLDNSEYQTKAKQMLSNVSELLNTYLPGYSNWAMLVLNYTNPFYETAVVGENAKTEIQNLHKNYQPNQVVIGSTNKKSDLALLENKFIEGKTTFYVCENKVCQLPVFNVSKATEQIKY